MPPFGEDSCTIVGERAALCQFGARVYCIMCAFFDVRGAHKLVRVHPREQGYSTFVFEDAWYVYRTCFSVRVGVHVGLGV